MKKPNSVLVIQTAFLGDVILATPIVSELNRLFPKVKIDFLVKKGNEILLSNNPAIRDVYVSIYIVLVRQESSLVSLVENKLLALIKIHLLFFIRIVLSMKLGMVLMK